MSGIEELIRRDIWKAAEKAAIEIWKREIYPGKFEPMIKAEFYARMGEVELRQLNN